MTTSALPETPVETRRSALDERSARTRALFSMAQGCDDDARRDLLNTVIEMHLDYAHSQAGRYRSRGIPLEDLQQVAAMALTKAARGYDVTLGHDFLSYAGPTIRGELRKHFRDHGWMIRPARRIQELQSRINAAQAEFVHQHGRSPQPGELAQLLQVPVECVIEALASDGYFAMISLDAPVRTEGTPASLGDMVPGGPSEHDAAEARLLLDPVLRTLAERDRLILGMRFYQGLTQREIGERLGITQMQVSRLIGRILGQLRHRVGELPS